jgi:F-box-like
MAAQQLVNVPGNHHVLLTDLPDELLNSIMSNLSDEDLARFAAVCPRLRDIVVLTYFNRVGFRCGETSLRIGGAYDGRYPFDVLKGIFLCGSIGALDELDCEFSTNAVLELGKVRDLMVRVPTVTSLRLWFSGDFLRDTREAFMKALFGLINELHGKSCANLTITNLFIPALFHPIDGDIWLQPMNTLRVVNLSMTTTYRCTPLLNWLISSVNSSPICKLHITSKQPWDATASALLNYGSVPFLTEFHVSPCPNVDQLVAFLRRHPSIQVLSVQLYDVFHTKTGLCTLPYLTKLVANPELAVWLLSSTKIPALHTVHLERSKSAFPTHTKRFKYVDTMNAVAVISKFPNIHSLAFDLGGRRVYIADPSVGMFRAKPQPALPKITHLTVFNAGEVVGLPQCIGIQFPNLETFVYDDDYSMSTAHERIHLLHQLHRVCPALSMVSFSAHRPVRPIARWLGQMAITSKVCTSSNCGPYRVLICF